MALPSGVPICWSGLAGFLSEKGLGKKDYQQTGLSGRHLSVSVYYTHSAWMRSPSGFRRALPRGTGDRTGCSRGRQTAADDGARYSMRVLRRYLWIKRVLIRTVLLCESLCADMVLIVGRPPLVKEEVEYLQL